MAEQDKNLEKDEQEKEIAEEAVEKNADGDASTPDSASKAEKGEGQEEALDRKKKNRKEDKKQNYNKKKVKELNAKKTKEK